jgi:hypothetical protein
MMAGLGQAGGVGLAVCSPIVSTCRSLRQLTGKAGFATVDHAETSNQMWNKEKILSVISIKGFREVPNNSGMTKAKMDTLCLTREAAEAIALPPFQRPLRVNEKVRCIAEEMKGNGGVIPGVMTIGELNGKRYWVDGQHRKESFLISGLREAYCDVRVCQFDTMAEMAEEYVRLNSRIVNMRPDDILRGLEESMKPLQIIRKECPFIGYAQIRRGSPNCPIVSMAASLRSWCSSNTEVPSPSGKGGAAAMAQSLTEEEAKRMAAFYNVCHNAWGRDPEYYRLWGEPNMALCAWLWRRTVLGGYNMKTTRFNTEQFTKGLMALSANQNYVDWLVGRNNTERDRSPAYNRIRNIIISRLQVDMGRKIYFPSPAWYTRN